jgi:hypothetical protein
MEMIQKHAIKVMASREEEKEKAQEEKFRANETFRKEIMDSENPERDRERERRNPPHEDKKKEFKDSVGLRPPAIQLIPLRKTSRCGPQTPGYMPMPATWRC